MSAHEPLDPLSLTRRHFLSSASLGLGSLALGSLLPGTATAAGTRGALGAPHFPRAEPAPQVSSRLRRRARRVIYLFQSGGPAQQDLFDYKPVLNAQNGAQLPE